jgi:LPS-assembly protein
MKELFLKLTRTMHILLILICLASYSQAVEEEETEISSDTLEYEKDSGAYFLKGNVEIRRGDLLLQADESYFDEKTTDALLTGGVTFEDKDLRIEADSAEINLNSRTGRIHNSYLLIKKENIHIKAREIEKKGEDHYYLKKARMTTCDAPVPAWCFNMSNADVLVGDRIKANNAVFRIKDVPVFYTPYLWAPILTDRKTGLLFPQFGYYSDLGAFYRQPLFIVLSDNRDATIRLDYYSNRGLGEGLEYRYVERGGISGKWRGYHIKDQELEKDFYLLKSSHKQYSKRGISHFIELDLLNEDEFYREYSNEFETRTNRFLESSGSVYYSSRFLRYYVSAQYWQDLDFDDGDISQKLPTVGISLHPVSMGPLLFSVNTEATNFYSTDSYEVQRYSISPGLALGLGNALRLNQTIKYNGAVYDISDTDDYPSSTERHTVNYDAGLITSIFKRYSKMTHTIEPELSYNYVSVSDYDAPLLDSQEVPQDRSDVVLSLTSDLVSDKAMFFSLMLAQPYDLEDEDLPWKQLEGNLYLNQGPYSLKMESFYDHYTENIGVFNGKAGLNFHKIRISAGYRHDKDNDINYYTGGLGFYITKSLFFDNKIQYDTEAVDEKVRDFKSSLIYSAQCWGLTLTYDQDPDDYSITFNFTLKGIGGLGTGPL